VIVASLICFRGTAQSRSKRPTPPQGQARSDNIQIRRAIKVTARDGVHLAGDYYTHGNPGPGVLLFHQCTRDRAIWSDLATTLANSGNQVLVVNPRGVGDSEGKPWDYDGVPDHALAYWRSHWSDDAEAAYQWLKSRRDVEREKVVAMGAGCGSFLAMLTAERHYPVVRDAVFFSDFDDPQSRQFLEKSPRLAILSMVSERDPMSFTAAKEIQRVSNNPASRLLTYPEHAHGYELVERHPELMSVVVKWVNAQLAGR